MTQRQRSLIGGISVLGVAGLICKVVGVLFRIPLSNMIGSLGMGLFGQVMPWYNLLLSITSAGIPVAISRMVSHYITIGEPGNARKVFKTAFKLLTVLGIVATIILLLFSRLIAKFVGTPEGYLSFICIAPSLFFVCIMSAYRGYMQGMRRMMPTAISQLIEQVGKVAVALPLASIGFARGGEETGWILGSAGALLGTSLAECAAMLYMIIRCHFVKPQPAQLNESSISGRALAKRIVMIAIPITLGACIVPLSNSIDSSMIKNLMMASGFVPDDAGSRHGLLTGIVFPLINVPTAIAMAMSTNLVPAVASGLARKDMKYVARETGISIGKVDRKCDAVLPDLRVEQPLVKHLIGVKVVSLFVHRQMVLHPVNDKRCACDPVRAGTHYRTEARRIIQIVFHVVKPQNDVLHDPVPVRRLEAHQDCSQICYRCAQAVCADRIERNLSSVAEFSKKFFSDSHFAPSSIF